MPADLIHRPEHCPPPPATVAEYADHDRDYLLFRIAELEGDLEAISAELATESAKNRRAADLAERCAAMALYGRETMLPEVKEVGRGRKKA